MDGMPPERRTPSHEAHNSSYDNHSQLSLNRDTAGSQLSPRSTSENRAPEPLPTGLNSMLKNTTETGDIGLFSIKSRYPATASRLNSPHKAGNLPRSHYLQGHQQNYGPCNGSPIVDDRRRLPSYARDATSEISSLYETGSQRSGITSRAFEEPDYRSYSMTQTSYSSYTLSNHRSYASLRSQPELSLTQRPRSPFPYPARLKRPGFRPSSPVLAGGGVVDYSRRAEIERALQDSGTYISSPGSLYAQKRMPPPLSLRPETNRSTPFCLGATSPPRRPHATSSVTSEFNDDWTNQYDSGHNRASPAPSTLSLASSLNINQVIFCTSTTPTPGRLHPPSPLYYDYTEDFDVEDEHNTGSITETLSPPSFLIGKTILEDRVLSSEWPSLVNNPTPTTQILQSAPCCTAFSSPVTTKSYVGSECSLSLPLNPQQEVNKAAVTPPEREHFMKRKCSREETSPVHLYENCDITAIDIPTAKISNRSLVDQMRSISNIEYGAQDLDEDAELESISNESSSLNMVTKLPTFPQPPDRLVRVHTDVPRTPRSEKGLIFKSESISRIKNCATDDLHNEDQLRSRIQPFPERTSSMEIKEVASFQGGTLFQHSNLNQESVINQSKNFHSSDYGMSELTQWIVKFGAINQSFSEDNVLHSQRSLAVARRTRTDSPTLPGSTCDSKTTLSRYRSDGDLRSSRSKASHQSSTPASLPLQNFHAKHHSIDGVASNLGPKPPHITPCRSESTMFAPTALSPARALKIKNSIPQLMKALPPLPPQLGPCPQDPSRLTCSPGIKHSASDFPFGISPLHQMIWQDPVPFVSDSSRSMQCEESSQGAEPHWEPEQSNLKLYGDLTPDCPAPKPFPFDYPKLKLKPRSVSGLRPMSSPDSRPWNQEENYTWGKIDPNVRLPSFGQKRKTMTAKPPKFKLKVIRASTSTFGTVKVNKRAYRHKVVSCIDLQNPRDLFTPSSASALTSVFRQVGRHFSSRKTSADIDQTAHGLRTPSTRSSRDRGSSLDLGLPSDRFAGLPYLGSSTEARSFFSDDSSQVQSRGGLRKRFSDLRARLPVSYPLRAQATQSCDDVVWRDQNRRPLNPAARSPLGVGTGRQNNDRIKTTGEIRTSKLKEKMSEWLRDTRAAIRGYMRKNRDSGQLPLFSSV